MQISCTVKVCFILMIFCHQILPAQPVVQFDNYPQLGLVRAIYHDSRYFMWFGTDDGLHRYDGYNFKSYIHIGEDKNSLCNNSIFSIAEDDADNLWIGTQNGLSRMDVANNRFENFFNQPGNAQSLSNNEVLNIVKDKQGNLWVGTSNGINRIESGTKIIFHSFSNLPINKVWFIAFDNNNTGWIASEKRLFLFNASLSPSQITFTEKMLPVNTASLSIRRLMFDSINSQMWLVTSQGILRYSYTNRKINEPVYFPSSLWKMQNAECATMLPDNGKGFWAGSLTNEGLAYVKLNRNQMYVDTTGLLLLQHAEANPYSILGNDINCIFRDRYNCIWIGTDEGASKYRKTRMFFQQGLPREAYSIFNNKPLSVINKDAEGNSWSGTNDGKVYLAGTKCNGFLFLPQSTDSNANAPLLNDIHRHSGGDLYLANFHGLVVFRNNELHKMISGCSYQPKGISIASKISDLSGYHSTYFICLLETKNRCMFTGTTAGLFQVDTITLAGSKVAFAEFLQAPQERVRSLAEQANGILWIGTDNGLFAYDYIQKKPVNLQHLIKNTALGSNFITCLNKSDHTNDIWIGTASGLYKYEASKNNIITYPALKNKHICKVVPHPASRSIFVSTFNGIYNLTHDNKIINYDVSDGLFSNKYNDGSGCRLNNGAVAFGSLKGVNSFFTDSLLSIYPRPHLSIIDLKINGNSVYDASTTSLTKYKNQFLKHEPLTLSSAENDIVVEYSSLNFLAADKNFYQYHLEGADETWIDNNHENNIRLKLAPKNNSLIYPGTYELKLRAKTPQSNWMELSSPLQISIRPPFNKSVEFFSLIALIVFGSTVYVVRYLSQQRLKEELREKEKLLAIERERNRISEDLHDDLGAGLSSIAMMTGVMRDLVTDDDAKVTADDVSTEANELVSRMREIIWSMNSKNDTIENLLSYLQEYSNKYLGRNKIACHLSLQGEIPVKNITGDKRENIFLVVKETLHNIVKYAQSQKVNVDITVNDSELHINVFDNGIGFDLNNVGRFGNGLANMKSRIEMAGGTYSIRSAPGSGTLTGIRVPIN